MNTADLAYQRPSNGKQTPAMLKKALQKHDIQHKLIDPFAPRQTGRVERSHHENKEYAYSSAFL